MSNEEIRPRVAPGEGSGAIGNRLATVELLRKLRDMGYTETEAKNYIKSGNVDDLGTPHNHGPKCRHVHGSVPHPRWEERR